MNNSTLDLDKYEDKPKYFLTKDNRVFERRKNYLYFVQMPVQNGNWTVLSLEESIRDEIVMAIGMSIQEMIIPNDLIETIYGDIFKVNVNDSDNKLIYVSIGQDKQAQFEYSKIKSIFKRTTDSKRTYTRVWIKPEMAMGDM